MTFLGGNHRGLKYNSSQLNLAPPTMLPIYCYSYSPSEIAPESSFPSQISNNPFHLPYKYLLNIMSLNMTATRKYPDSTFLQPNNSYPFNLFASVYSSPSFNSHLHCFTSDSALPSGLIKIAST